MKHSDFKIGMEFTMGYKIWRVTDIGTRTIVAIRIDEVTNYKYDIAKRTGLINEILNKKEAEDQGWFEGPPYAVSEVVLDEDDLPVCEPI